MRFTTIFKQQIVLLLVLLISSCQYDTDEIYTNNIDINKIPPPDLTIQLNLDSDTVYICGESWVKLTFQLTNKKLYGVEFFINDKPFQNVIKSGENGYTVEMGIYNYEIAKVKVLFYISTGSGSIADKLNAEAFVLQSKEWTLIKIPESELPPVKYDVENGRLKLSWIPPVSDSQVKFQIHKDYIIGTTSNNWFIDSTFTGGYASYSLQCDGNISHYWLHGEAAFEIPKLYIDQSVFINLNWDKSIFYNAIDGYRIAINNGQQETVIDKNINDTSYVYKNGVYGSTTSIILNLLQKRTNILSPQVIPVSVVTKSYPENPFNRLYNLGKCLYPQTGNTFYLWNNDLGFGTIVKFSTENKEYTSFDAPRISAESHSSVSPNNIYLLYDAGRELKVIKTETMETVKTILTDHIIPSGSYTGSGISDIGTVAYWDDNLKNLVIYALLKESIVCSIPFNDGHKYSGILSGNGKYLFEPWQNALYEIGVNNFTKIHSDPSVVQRYNFTQFSTSVPNQLVLYDGSEFIVKNCDDFSTVRSFVIEGASIINVDFQNSKILTYNNKNFHVYSLLDGKLLNTIPTALTNNTFLLNNKICSSIGILDLNKLK